MASDVSFLQAAEDAADQTTYTFAGQDFGAEASDRYIIVGIGSRDTGSGAKTVDSVTIGGVTATIVRQAQNATTNSTVGALAIAAVPTGLSGSVVVTFSEQMLRCGIGVWRIVGHDPTAHDSDSSTATDPTVNLDIPANGSAVGFATTGNTGATTWTGLTESFDGNVDGLDYTGASDDFVTQQSGLTILANFSATADSVGIFASWGPAAGGGGGGASLMGQAIF